MSAVSTRTGNIQLVAFKSKQLQVAFEAVEGGTDIARPMGSFTHHLVVANQAGTVIEDITGALEYGTTNVVLFTITATSTASVGLYNIEWVIVGGATGVKGDTMASGTLRVRNSLKVYS